MGEGGQRPSQWPNMLSTELDLNPLLWHYSDLTLLWFCYDWNTVFTYLSSNMDTQLMGPCGWKHDSVQEYLKRIYRNLSWRNLLHLFLRHAMSYARPPFQYYSTYQKHCCFFHLSNRMRSFLRLGQQPGQLHADLLIASSEYLKQWKDLFIMSKEEQMWLQ